MQKWRNVAPLLVLVTTCVAQHELVHVETSDDVENQDAGGEAARDFSGIFPLALIKIIFQNSSALLFISFLCVG
jgi:hypothetical protein